MSGFRTLIFLLAITILLVAPAEASTSYYAGGSSAEAAFNAAVGGLTLLNPSMTFSAGDLASGGLYNASGTSIDFLGLDDFFFNDPLDFTVSSGKLVASHPAEQVRINFPALGVYAFGVHISVVSSFGLWCVELSPGACNYSLSNSSSSDANVQFFGLVSTAPVSAPLYIRPSAFSPTLVLPSFEAFTKVQAPAVSSTPEPDTLVLAGIGLVILQLARRRVPRRM
jgi:hypothetical protein